MCDACLAVALKIKKSATTALAYCTVDCGDGLATCKRWGSQQAGGGAGGIGRDFWCPVPLDPNLLEGAR